MLRPWRFDAVLRFCSRSRSGHPEASGAGPKDKGCFSGDQPSGVRRARVWEALRSAGGLGEPKAARSARNTEERGSRSPPHARARLDHQTAL